MEAESASNALRTAGSLLLRYGLALVTAWIGAMKFTAYEAAAIRPLVESSPFMSWMYAVLSERAVSSLSGVVELCAVAAIALRPLSAAVAAAGSAVATGMFLATLSFLFSLPGWEPSLGGFPALSGSGGFLVKDLVLLGASVWTLGESFSSVSRAGRRAESLS